jgi:uncharacterized Zn-binding protein involved in type VI secretion
LVAPAARSGDPQVCPEHGPGVIAGPGASAVLIGGAPAARATDLTACAAAIALGSGRVLIDLLPAARVGDPTAHGGTIAAGDPSVLIGG